MTFMQHIAAASQYSSAQPRMAARRTPAAPALPTGGSTEHKNAPDMVKQSEAVRDTVSLSPAARRLSESMRSSD